MAKSSVDLLTSIPQPKSTWEKIFDWTFSVGRYIVVFVEAIVLVAFVSRFAMDRVKNDLDTKISQSVNLLRFYESSGKTDKVLNNFYAITAAREIITDQPKYSVLFKDVVSLIGTNAKILSINVQDQKVRVIGVSTNLTKVKAVENAFKTASYLKNVNFDLSSEGGNQNSQVEFTVDAEIDQTRYFGNFITN